MSCIIHTCLFASQPNHEVLMMTDEVADEDYYYLHDHLKSPVALLDIDGEVLERYEYDAYGKATLWEGDYDNLLEGPSWYNNPYYFTGRRNLLSI